MSGDVLWSYCLVPGGDQILATSIEGVSGAPLKLIPCGSLSMAVSELPETEFGEVELNRRLKDPDWTPAIALAHFGAVEALFALGPVLPLRMCTVFRSAESAAAAVHAEAATLSAALSRVQGCEQWAVTVRAASTAGAEVTADVATSGTDYLRSVATRRAAVVDRQALAESAAALLHQRLADIAVAVETADPERGAVRAGAYLVQKASRDGFLEAVGEAEHGAEPVAVDLRGPWAPYSFVPRLGSVA